MQHSPLIPEIETERLRLRAWREGDITPMTAIHSDPAVTRWLGRIDPSQTESRIRVWTERWRVDGFGLWAIEEKASGLFIGRVGLVHHDDWVASDHDAEIGWTLSSRVWGKGYATETAHAALDWARRPDRPRNIISITRPDNARSRRVMEKLGLTYRGQTHWHGFDQVWYAIELSSGP